MATVDLPLGTVGYRVFGPDHVGPTVVFVHGFLVDGTLWDPVAERLAAAGIRSIVADWPLGSHRIPVPAGSDLSPNGVARSVLDLIDALHLDQVVLVGNDTGGALCQLALRDHGGRIDGLVLTNCDGFETFPPAFFKPVFHLARRRSGVWAMCQAMRLKALRHSPLAFGQLLRSPRSANLTRGWAQPALSDPAIRHDVARFARQVRGDELVDAASWLGSFDGPCRIVWGARDRHFTAKLGARIAAAIPGATLIEVPQATTFVSIDAPALVADSIRQVAAALPSVSAPAGADLRRD